MAARPAPHQERWSGPALRDSRVHDSRFGDLRNVLVAAPTDAQQHMIRTTPSAHVRRSIHATACAVSSAGMIPSRRLNSVSPRRAASSSIATYVARAAVLEIRVLRTDARVVQAGGDGVRGVHLAVRRPAAGSSATRAARPEFRAKATLSGARESSPSPAASTPIELDGGIVKKARENPHRVGTAADARHYRARQSPSSLEHLLARLPPNDRLKFTHHTRIRRGPDHRPDDVVTCRERS